MWLWVGDAPPRAWQELVQGRDVEFGQDVPLSAPLWRLARGCKGGRMSRRGSLDPFQTSPVIKPGQV